MNIACAWISVLLAFPATLWTFDAYCETAKQVTVRCVTVAQKTAIPCKVSVTPPSIRDQEGTSVTLDLTGPTIKLDIGALGYDSREIHINAASKKDRVTRIEIYLTRSFTQGQTPTLGMVRAAKSSIQNGDIDKAIAIIEQIRGANRTYQDGGTFQTNYLYYRAAALLQGCTVLFYYTCDSAKAAMSELEGSISRSPDDFKREKITADEIRRYPIELEVAVFRHTIARAKWYLAERQYRQAKDEYEDALTAFDEGGPEFQKKTRVTSTALSNNIKYIETKIRMGQTTGIDSVTAVGQLAER